MYEVESIMQMLQQYFGKNALPVIAFLAVICWTKKSKNRKRYLLCVTVMFALLLNDFVFEIVVKVGEGETYYRVLWILPVTLLAAYLGVELWSELFGWKRIGMTILMLGFIWIYAVPAWDSWLDLPTNIYQLDNETIEVADMIEKHSGGKRVNIIDDYSISWHIREYSDNLCDPGAEAYALRLLLSEKCLTFSKDEIDYAVLDAQSDYVILQKEKEGANAVLIDAEFELVGSSENYNIYYMNRQEIVERMSVNGEEW